MWYFCSDSKNACHDKKISLQMTHALTLPESHSPLTHCYTHTYIKIVAYVCLYACNWHARREKDRQWQTEKKREEKTAHAPKIKFTSPLHPIYNTRPSLHLPAPPQFNPAPPHVGERNPKKNQTLASPLASATGNGADSGGGGERKQGGVWRRR